MKIFFFLLALLLSLLLAAGFLLPRELRVEREIVIQRPATTVFTLLHGFRSFPSWSSWVAADPDLTLTRSGPDFGPGARLDWSGDPLRSGTGWQEIQSSVPPSLITLSVHGGPQSDATVNYVVRGDAIASRVRWVFETDVSAGKGIFSSWLGRYFGVFLERWAGAELEEGLAALKTYAESLPAADFAGAEVELMTLSPEPIARQAAVEGASVDAAPNPLAQAFADLTAWAMATGAQLGGEPLVLMHGEPGQGQRFEAAIPLEAPPRVASPAGSAVEVTRSPGGLAARLVQRGSQANTLLGQARLEAWARAHGYRPLGTRWIHYVTDPAVTPEQDLLTHLYLLLEDDVESSESVSAKRSLQGPGVEG